MKIVNVADMQCVDDESYGIRNIMTAYISPLSKRKSGHTSTHSLGYLEFASNTQLYLFVACDFLLKTRKRLTVRGSRHIYRVKTFNSITIYLNQCIFFI